MIEDLSLAYYPDWEGGPPSTPRTGAALVKDLVDRTLSGYGDPFSPPISGMDLYAEIAFLQRAQ